MEAGNHAGGSLEEEKNSLKMIYRESARDTEHFFNWNEDMPSGPGTEEGFS